MEKMSFPSDRLTASLLCCTLFFSLGGKRCRSKYCRGIRLPLLYGRSNGFIVKWEKGLCLGFRVLAQVPADVCRWLSPALAQCCSSSQKRTFAGARVNRLKHRARGSKRDVTCVVNRSELTATTVYFCHFNMLSKVPRTVLLSQNFRGTF